jgi:6-phosphogluconolactonase (cycloisomerase 2 family)
MTRAKAALAIALVLFLVASSALTSPVKGFLYVTSGFTDLYSFEIDSATATLTALPTTPLPPGTVPRGPLVLSTGPFLYELSAFPNTVLAFHVSASDGSLAPVAGSPFAASGDGAIAGAIDGSGKFLYVGNNISGDIGAFRIGPSGELTPVPGQPFPAGTFGNAGSMAADPAGRFLFVSASGLRVFRIDSSTGALTETLPIIPPFVECGGEALATDPTGRFLYAAQGQNQAISVCGVDASSGDLVLTPVAGSPFFASPRPISLGVDPQGRFLFAGNAFGFVSAFSVDPTTGVLAPVPGSPFLSGNQPNSFFVDPTGAALFVADPGMPGSDGAVWAYSIDPTTGALTNTGQFASGPSPFTLGGLGNVATNRPPDCGAARPSTSVIWPPNHKIVPISILGVTDPEGGSVAITIDSIRQDEPVNGPGPDGVGVGTAFAGVRAERNVSGDGRVYHLAFTARDAEGAACSGVVTVAVPRHPQITAVDGGPLYDSTLCSDCHP